MDVIKFVIWVAAAYFIGNISPSIILGKLKGVDIKKEGSGNAGTTNALRVLGKKSRSHHFGHRHRQRSFGCVPGKQVRQR